MSKIEWTEKTWNPIVGCTKISPGCENCYAIKMAYRLMHNPKMAGRYKGTAKKMVNGQLNWTGNVNMLSEVLQHPLKVNKPTMFFVNSMSDLFHDAIPFEFIAQVFDVMATTSQHTYQVLTKRPKRMLEFFEWFGGTIKQNGYDSVPTQSESLLDYVSVLPNVWLGVSVENQKALDERVHILLQVPAAIHFLSCEPLLGNLDFKNFRQDFNSVAEAPQKTNTVDWVIVGGESGHNSRPMHPKWALSIRDQCLQMGVQFFFKQWGEYGPHPGIFHHQKPYTFEDGTIVYKAGKHKNGRMLDDVFYDGMPIIKKSCSKSCGPSDYCEGGKCDINGCYEKTKK